MNCKKFYYKVDPKTRRYQVQLDNWIWHVLITSPKNKSCKKFKINSIISVKCMNNDN